MRGLEAISRRRLRAIRLLASALASGAVIFACDVEAANWSSHSTSTGGRSSSSAATPTPVTVSSSATVSGVTITGDVTALGIPTTTTTTSVSATGATKTTTTTSYSSLSGIVVSGTSSVGGGPPIPFAYSFPSLAAASEAASAKGFTVTATPSAAAFWDSTKRRT